MSRSSPASTWSDEARTGNSGSRPVQTLVREEQAAFHIGQREVGQIEVIHPPRRWILLRAPAPSLPEKDQFEPEPPRVADMLAASAWWPALAAADRERTLAEIDERRFTGGSVVMRKGEVVDARTGVVDGLVNINVVSPGGKTATFTGVGPGGWFGEGSILKDEPRKYDVVALRDTRIAWMPRRTFEHLMDTSIPFNRFLLTQLNERLWQFIGMVEYERLLEPDARVARGKRPPTLLLLEHPHVYTFGRRGRQENLLWGEQQLKEKGIAIHWVDRGGDVTYHGPGQLVGYLLIPLVPLTPTPLPAGEERRGEGESHIPQADYVGYIRKLEQTIITALARLGLASGQRPGLTGVSVQADVHSRCPRCKPEDRRKPAKIAAIGVKVDARGVSRHGFALNVDPDMEYWDGIIACGLHDEPIVSLADLFPELPSMERASAS